MRKRARSSRRSLVSATGLMPVRTNERALGWLREQETGRGRRLRESTTQAAVVLAVVVAVVVALPAALHCLHKRLVGTSPNRQQLAWRVKWHGHATPKTQSCRLPRMPVACLR